MTEPPAQNVLVPMRWTGGMLVDAGLAGWVLAHAGRDERASRTVVMQDVIDASTDLDAPGVEVPVAVALEAVGLWEEASAVLTEGQAITGTPAQLAGHAKKLDRIAKQLRSLLHAAGATDLDGGPEGAPR